MEPQASANFPARVIARLFNLTERRIQQLAREGIIPKADRGQYPLAGTIRGYITYLQNAGVNAEGTVDPEKLDPFKKRAYFQAELEKLKLAVEKSELISSFEVEQLFSSALKKVSEFFDTIPDVLERDCGLTAQQVLKVEQRVDLLREELYKMLMENSGDVRRPAKTRK